MFGGHGDQRDRGVIEPDGDGHRVMVASAGVKQIDAVAEVLFDADAGVDVLIKRQSRLGGNVIPCGHPLLLGLILPQLPVAQRMVVVRRQAEIFSPRLGADAAASQAFAQHLVIKRVIAQQPAADPPALAKPNVAHQIVLAPGHRILVPRQVAIVILQWHEPAPFTAGELPLFIDQQVDIGVAPWREPALQLVAHFIAEFVNGEHLRLFARRQSVIAHAGLAELLSHFGKVSGVVIDLRGDPQIGQGRFFLGSKSGVAGGQRPDGNARQQQENDQGWQQTVRHRHQLVLRGLAEKIGRWF